jgi:hypothetical protein
MNQSSELQEVVSSECPRSQRNIRHGKPVSGPPGNRNAVKHGVHSLAAQ